MNTFLSLLFIQVVAAIEQICTHDCYGHGTCIGNGKVFFQFESYCILCD